MESDKTITLTAYNRPHYLKQVIESLRKNNTAGYTLSCFVEPGNEEVIQLCKSIDFLPCNVTVNEKKLGVRRNPYNALDTVFGRKSQMNVYLEDDVIISPDALDLANWYYVNQGTSFCMTLFNYGSKATHPNLIINRSESNPRGFSALGLVIGKRAWHKWWQPNWFKDLHRKGIGWDWTMNALILQQKLTFMQPAWGRSNHIGREGGTFCEAAFHDKTFAPLSISDGSRRDYTL